MSEMRMRLGAAVALLAMTGGCGNESGPGPMEPTGPTTGSVQVTVVTTGESVPASYSLAVDGGVAQPIGANLTSEIRDLAAGDHELLILNIAVNCEVEGENPRTVRVTAGGVVSENFSLTCTTTLGSVAISTTTTGPDIDSDGYFITLDGGVREPIGSNDLLTLSDVEAGTHVLTLTGMTGNCVVAEPTPRTVDVMPAKTVSLDFVVVCEEAPSNRIVFSKNEVVFVMDATGSNPVGLRPGAGPVFSPDGSRIVFNEPVGYWYELSVMNDDGSDPVNLTSLTSFFPWGNPAWSPDGSRIVFPGSDGFDSSIHLVDPDGSNVTRISDGLSDLDPAWSPDGTKLAFARISNDNSDLYMVDADGSNLVRLTDHPGHDADPTWSPDGTRIAFETDRDGNFEIYVMDADGSNPIPLTDDPAADQDAAWSPDGTKLAFATDRDGNYELYWMDADGARPRRLTYDQRDDRDPAWSP